MYENRRINTESRQKIDELMNQISGYSNIKTLLNEEKERKEKFTNQINFYENELKVMEEKIKSSPTYKAELKEAQQKASKPL